FQSIPNAALGTALYAVGRPALGLRPPAVWSGLRYGVAAGGLIVAGVAATTAIPSVRRGMAARELPEHPLKWLVFDIPFRTVWPEEVA
ncbi:hypothetical protein JQS35_18960, partial [Alcaligenes faecalis subsp. faecalis]|uniref:hypothetical protein n=1 Tax=Alcaligenes faecalis TaxID=511 RepID=UPI001F2072B5